MMMVCISLLRLICIIVYVVIVVHFYCNLIHLELASYYDICADCIVIWCNYKLNVGAVDWFGSVNTSVTDLLGL